MSAWCRSCGAPVPKGQKLCSMCVGDPDHGSDGHYRRQLEEEERRERDREEAERQWQEQDR